MIHAGIAAVDLPHLLGSASRRIIFHAALYSRFAESTDVTRALCAALERAQGDSQFLGLHCICLDAQVGNSPATAPSRKTPATPQWASEFLTMLRPQATPAERAQEFSLSEAFVTFLAGKYGPLVHRHTTQALPCAPILIIDDLILVGHYLHGEIPAPEGYWFSLSAPVDHLFSCARQGIPPATPQDRAAYRFVSECLHAMQFSGYTAKSPDMTCSPTETGEDCVVLT